MPIQFAVVDGIDCYCNHFQILRRFEIWQALIKMSVKFQIDPTMLNTTCCFEISRELKKSRVILYSNISDDAIK